MTMWRFPLAAVLGAIMLVSGIWNTPVQAGERPLKVVASFSILGDMAARIGGPAVSIARHWSCSPASCALARPRCASVRCRFTAAALRCLGGQILARFIPRNDSERLRCLQMGIDPDRIYDTADLASGSSIIFAATGATDGSLLKGVRFFGGGARTHSLVMGLQSSTIRFVDTVHMFDSKAFGRVRL